MDGKINVALTGRDLLDSRHRHTITSGPGFDQESESWRQGRNVRLTISYSFGNMRGSKNRDAGRDDDNMSEGMYEEY